MPKLGLGLGLGPRNNKQYLSFDEKNRIIYDGGIARNQKALEDTLRFFNTLMPNTKLLYCPELGVKLRTSGIYNYVTTLYDLGPGMIDGTQTTALNQPYLSGNIAPNEKYAIKNPNGGNRYITHTPISFLSTDKWSVSTIVSGYGNTINQYPYYAGQPLYGLGLQNGSSFEIRFVNNVSSASAPTKKYLGKNTVITWVSIGNGSLYAYINGELLQTFSGINTEYIESEIGRGRGTSLAYQNAGTILYHCIRDIALSPTQVQDEYTYLRTLFPEIESVQIGTQTWATSNCEMTCTPKGNFIQEMQAATNVEKISNGISLTDSDNNGLADGFSTHNNPITSIVTGNGFPGRAQRVEYRLEGGTLQSLLFRNVLSQNKLYRLSFKYRANKEYMISDTGYGVPGGILPVNTGDAIEKTIYFNYSRTGNMLAFNSWLQNSGDWFEIGDITLQEVGWADSTNLYNYIYANTSGTAEQKEYAAVKAAAMWCYPNNDPALGAVYGKLYNWYAVKLLQMDIDYYNAANPTTPWGWRVPTSSDFTALSSYLGGNAVSGGKMKKEGTVYWSAPNDGATNESGFSGIGTGRRSNTGSFGEIYTHTYFNLSNESNFRVKLAFDSNYLQIALFYDNAPWGRSLRLIKA